jgi:hypothetical protein
MSKDIFLTELQEKPISYLVSKWVIDRIPFVFNDDLESYIIWKERLAKEINVDSKAMIFVGSSGCGFSLNPYKNYKEFDKDSDIDIALISQYHFNIAWHHLRNLGTKRYSLTPIQKAAVQDHVNRLIYWGTIATDKLLEIFPFGKSWLLILEKARIDNPIAGRDIKIRLYRNFESLRAYQKMNLEALRTEYLGSKK